MSGSSFLFHLNFVKSALKKIGSKKDVEIKILVAVEKDERQEFLNDLKARAITIEPEPTSFDEYKCEAVITVKKYEALLLNELTQDRQVPSVHTKFTEKSYQKLKKITNEMDWSRASIWDEDFCNRCGVCCYFLKIEGFKHENSLCEHLEIEENKQTTCKIYEKRGKPDVCSRWYCDLAHLGNPFQRSTFREYAMENIKSLPVSYRKKKYKT